MMRLWSESVNASRRHRQVPYRVVEDGSGNVKIASSNAKREFAPEEISAQVLRKLTEDAAKFLNDSVRSLAIPVSFQMECFEKLASSRCMA